MLAQRPRLRSLAAFFLAGIKAGSIALGLGYLFARTDLPYHAHLTGLGWGEIAPRYQAVIFGMLKMVGVGMLVFGIARLWQMWPLHQGEPWAAWTILSLVGTQEGSSSTSPLCCAWSIPRPRTNVLASGAGAMGRLRLRERPCVAVPPAARPASWPPHNCPVPRPELPHAVCS